MAKKYISIEKLSTFLNNLKDLFATKADVETILPSAKSYSDAGNTTTLEGAKSYADTVVAQKSQVQIITWGADD